jgi:hypothetical protein
MIMKVSSYLTPCIPLSLRGIKGEGEEKEEGLTPLLNAPAFLV